ncbi:hypothetical protein JKP88DRAFT_221697 [Tribonema minus]|uniref:Uncharacterized protein n=1 Tax=Tribonema minus TaxID=303371 RepID=A0A836CD34_9STRA|nr:hypothetical protein JKP88DRAFT_221697 [Tribonema minus]
MHAEPVVTAQHVAAALLGPAGRSGSGGGSTGGGGGDGSSPLAGLLGAQEAALCAELVERAGAAARLLPDACRRSEWMGGATAHPATFAAVYGALATAAAVMIAGRHHIPPPALEEAAAAAAAALAQSNFEIHPYVTGVLRCIATAASGQVAGIDASSKHAFNFLTLE